MANRRQRDKEQTMQDVLAAARRLFSEKGLHGTSLRDLELASGVSKGLILHHFGTKEHLYATVQDLLVQEYITRMAERRESQTDLKELIRTAIREALSQARKNSELQRISLWSHLEGQDRTTELGKRFTTVLIEAMRSGQQAGLVRDDIDAFLMPFIVRGAIDYWVRSESLRRALVSGTRGARASDKDLVDALMNLMLV
jgi:AcrR family transcriptional regulator